MKKNNKIALIIAILACCYSSIDHLGVECRRFGGGFRGGGSRFRSSSQVRRPVGNNGYNNRAGGYNNGYRGGGGGWASFGSGMLAYGLMSNLAHRNYHQSQYYNHNQQNGMYGQNGTQARKTGKVCINNEDFNGTKFGQFQCPMPGFSLKATYCCGAKSEQRQYCCQYFDDSSRKWGVILAVAALIGAVASLCYCAQRVAEKREVFSKLNERDPATMMQNMNNRPFNQQQQQMRSGNGGGYPRQPQQQQQQQQQNNTSHVYNQQGPMPQQRPSSAYPAQAAHNNPANQRAPFIPPSSQNNAQQQQQQQQAKPQNVNANQPPPAYNDVVK